MKRKLKRRHNFIRRAAMKNQTYLNIFGMILTCMLTIFQVGCSKPEPILIGFSGQLSGAYADLGIKGRDGVLLAVEKINEAGGIAGRHIKLLVQDDKGTPEGARAADQELIDAGVAAIIGHMTSGQTMAAMEVIEKAGVVLISPTTSTEKLTGIDDHFFRVAVTNSTDARLLARHVHQNRGFLRLASIFDTDNAAYTNSYWDAFSNEYKTRGGQVTGSWGFSSSKKPDFGPIVSEIHKSIPDALLIIASPLDTALIAQKIRANAPKIPLFSSAWGQTDAMLQHGGKAVEGLEIVIWFDSDSQNPAYQDFRNLYLAKFGREPTFAGGAGYEAMLVLAVALKKTKGQADGLPEALKGIRKFEGLVGAISMDEYGDVVRTHFLHIVKSGDFITKSFIEP
jgi:branched-chain amino acid transport system substrate-binding protein